MLSQFLDVLKAIGHKNRISAIHILIVSLIIVFLQYFIGIPIGLPGDP